MLCDDYHAPIYWHAMTGLLRKIDPIYQSTSYWNQPRIRYRRTISYNAVFVWLLDEYDDAPFKKIMWVIERFVLQSY